MRRAAAARSGGGRGAAHDRRVPAAEDPVGSAQPRDPAAGLQSRQLARSFEEYLALARQAEQYKSDYEHAARDCGLWQTAIVLTGFLVSNPGMNIGNLPVLVRGNLSPQSAKALEQFYNFLSLIDKVTTGDASWLVPSASFKDFAKLPNPQGGFWTPRRSTTVCGGRSSSSRAMSGSRGRIHCSRTCATAVHRPRTSSWTTRSAI